MCHVCSWVYYSEQMASLLTQPLDRLLGFYSPHTSKFSKIQSILKELFDLALKMETPLTVWNLKRMVRGPVVPPTSHLPELVSFHCRLFIRALLCRKCVPPTELPHGLSRCHGCQCLPEVMSFLSASLDTTGHTDRTHGWCISKSLAWLTASQHWAWAWRLASELQWVHMCYLSLPPSLCPDFLDAHGLLGGPSLTIIILVKVSLCDSMQSIRQTLNCVVTHRAQQMDRTDILSVSAVACFSFY